MRDKLIKVVCNFIINTFATKEYKSNLNYTYKLGLATQEVAANLDRKEINKESVTIINNTFSSLNTKSQLKPGVWTCKDNSCCCKPSPDSKSSEKEEIKEFFHKDLAEDSEDESNTFYDPNEESRLDEEEEN